MCIIAVGAATRHDLRSKFSVHDVASLMVNQTHRSAFEDVSVIVSSTRSSMRRYWRQQHANVFVVDAESITHESTGFSWGRVSVGPDSTRNPTTSHSPNGGASTLRQMRQYTDLLAILTFTSYASCFSSAHVMLVDDDAVMCQCLPRYLRRVLQWLSNVSWRMARFSVGTNGIVLPCDKLPHVIDFLHSRWVVSNFSCAIDLELSNWALPFMGAPIGESREYVLRQVMLEHASANSTIWDTRHSRAWSCGQLLVWNSGMEDVRARVNYGSFDAVRCSQFLVSPCSRVDTPRRLSVRKGSKCDASSPYSNGDFLRAIVSGLHVLPSRHGESCSSRCKRAVSSHCEARMGVVLSDVHIFSFTRPATCELVYTHLVDDVGPHLIPVMPVGNQSSTVCVLQSVTEGINGSALFNCRASRRGVQRLCPCLKGSAAQPFVSAGVRSRAACGRGTVISNGVCAPCPIGTQGRGGNESCTACAKRARWNSHHARVGASSLDECALSCVNGDEIGRGGSCAHRAYTVTSMSSVSLLVWAFVMCVCSEICWVVKRLHKDARDEARLAELND
jgi:hypothetical protein